MEVLPAPVYATGVKVTSRVTCSYSLTAKEKGNVVTPCVKEGSKVALVANDSLYHNCIKITKVRIYCKQR